ncbi:MAG: fructosamine kinase family protein, partial [Actinomycetota bacterium]|nr:fructosamine kinase family protein [Actinomycetota bacterium]
EPAEQSHHREVKLAMAAVGCGFGSDCFAAYEEMAPLADGWVDRIPLHQLAPLVVHAIKFGGPYVGATQQALAAVTRLL